MKSKDCKWDQHVVHIQFSAQLIVDPHTVGAKNTRGGTDYDMEHMLLLILGYENSNKVK